MTQHIDLVLERTLDAPVDLVWAAYTDPEHLKQWFAPKPYQITECELDLRPGGIFRIRMVGPDGFDTGHGGAGCVLEVEQGKKLTWTSALGPGYRPAEMGEGCESFPMTAIVTFEDAGNGRTAYRAVALHKDAKDKETHEKMGFHDGWGTVAGQLEEFAKSLKVSA
ncbi:SRPBCC family protein [Sphingomonas sediminicola]|uniref:SRPBCC family protein n=1 Tax=Sphingomonas sediminicola TaxID=386874 RepID=A0ABX6T657_9SPHN|nr:SRPBCC family protein [Sphingomonas sediminicola]QNP45125.1 SRPBCC family protein [Sphingomonas sediminicola]